jgi:RNA polymerase sigma-70 factor (ECF subfamily)
LNQHSLHNEHQLLLETAAGSEQAFEKIVDHYRAFIFSFALRVIGDEFTAAEIVQDTFLKVWLKKEELPGIHNFPGWVYTIAERFSYTALTKSSRERSYFDQWLAEAAYREHDEDGNAYQEERNYEAILNKAVDRLPPKQKETYRLIKEQGLARNEAAQLLQVSPETVKWNLEKAMTSIRTYCLSHLKDPGAQAIILLLLQKYL